ncbi:hypothetical protein [Sphingobium sp.]|uniref:hypothetical protein n=1 Tax=Sphingobium sp. TaxID=1912891 RepID=UPI002612DB20|nr:hypothetical protein [Sphingobium sp.]
MAIGDLIEITIVGGGVVTDSGYSPNVNGACAALRFEGLNKRHPLNDPVTDATKLSIVVQDPGFDASLNPITRTRTVRGTLPLKEPFPKLWSAFPSTVPPRSYCANNNIAYYTEAGGTKGATAPTHASGTVSDGGVSWTRIAADQLTGFVEQVSGGDVIVHVMLDMPIYAGSTIVSASIEAGAYTVGGTSNGARSAGITLTNASALQYEPVQSVFLTPPHKKFEGSAYVELKTDHSWGMHIGGGSPVAGARFTAWNNARTTASPVVSVSTPTLSTDYDTSSPGGCAVECLAATLNTSGIAAGDCFVEVEIFPWLGVPFRTRFDGEGADWQGSRAYAYAGIVVRNGANLYQLTTAGTSAASGGPTGTGTGIADGSCVWSYVGNLPDVQNSRNIPARWHFYNDPANVYKTGYCFVDPAGTATGVAGVFSTFAAADAAKGTLSNCYPTIAAAATALVTYNNTVDGVSTIHNDCGNGRIYLKAGSHSGFGASMTSLARPSVWLFVQADPSAAAGTVEFLVGAVKAVNSRLWIGDGIKFTATATGTGNIFIDPVKGATGTIGQIDSELVISGGDIRPFDASQPFAFRAGLVWYLNNSFTNYFVVRDSNTRWHLALVAGNRLDGNLSATGKTVHLIGNTIIGKNVIADTDVPIIPAMFNMIQDNKVLGLTGTTGGSLISVLSDSGTLGYPRLGYSISGNLVKSASYSGDKCAQISADGVTRTITNIVISYNSFVGQRKNGPYNDSSVQYKAQWFEGFNISTSDNVIYDTTGHSGNNPDGVRCQNYWGVYRVGYRANLNLIGSENGTNFVPNGYSGLRAGIASKWNMLTSSAQFSAQFADDKTGLSSSPSNVEGDYHPAAGAHALNMAVWQARTFDLSGDARRTDGSGAVGAFERTDPPPVSGNASATFAAFTTISAAALALAAAGSLAFAPMTSLSAGNLAAPGAGTGTVTVTLAPLSSSSAGALALAGVAAPGFAPLTSLSAGNLANPGSATGASVITFSAMTGAAAADLALAAAASLSFAPMTGIAAGFDDLVLPSIVVSTLITGNPNRDFPTPQNFSLFAGDAKTLKVTVFNEEGDPIPLAGVQAVTWRLARTARSVPVLTKTIGAGVTVIADDAAEGGANCGRLDVVIESADSDPLDGEYVHECQIVDASGARSAIFYGRANVAPSLN